MSSTHPDDRMPLEKRFSNGLWKVKLEYAATVVFGVIAFAAAWWSRIDVYTLLSAGILGLLVLWTEQTELHRTRLGPWLPAVFWLLLASSVGKSLDESSTLGIVLVFLAILAAIVTIHLLDRMTLSTASLNAQDQTATLSKHSWIAVIPRCSLPAQIVMATVLTMTGLALSMLLVPMWVPGEYVGSEEIRLKTGAGLSNGWLQLAMMGLSLLWMRPGLDHYQRLRFPILAGIAGILLSGSYSVTQAMAVWFHASAAEREVWNDAHAARFARVEYLKALDRWRHVGLARQGSWFDSVLRRRSAITALDAGSPLAALIHYPPARYGFGQSADSARRIWNAGTLTELAHAPCTTSPEAPRLYVDAEWIETANGYEHYALDLWGRIWRLIDPADDTPITESIGMVWQPEPLFPGTACDLERFDTAWIVLGSDGRVDSTIDVPWLDTSGIRLGLDRRLIGLEFLPSGKGALIVSSHGEVYGLGEIPAELPLFETIQFPAPVIVDFELDRDGGAYYLLDRHGAIHAYGEPDLPYTKPQVPNAPYWEREAPAIDLELAPPGMGFYIALVHGDIFPVEPVPHRYVYRHPYRRKHPDLPTFNTVALGVGRNDRLYLYLANGSVFPVPRE